MEGYRQESRPAACLPKTKCEFSFAPPIIDVLHQFPVTWVPVAPPLEKGEIVFAAAKRYRSDYGSTAQGSYGPPSPWMLGRVTRLGAVVEWIDPPLFAKLATTPEAKAALATAPLSDVSSLGIAPDGGRLCLAEGGRVWELMLANGLPTSVDVADNGPGLVACGYDEAGTLARLVGSPAAIRSGNKTIAGKANTPAFGLARVAGQWLIHSKGEQVNVMGKTAVESKMVAPKAYCVDANGKITPTEFAMTGTAEVPTGVAFLDADGEAWTGRNPCAADSAFPQEQLGTDLREEMNREFSPRPNVGIEAGALAMRPDGLFLVSPGKADMFSEALALLFWMSPTYTPSDPANRIVENDPYRRTKMRFGVAATWPVSVNAMVTIPGGDPKADWGHFKPEAPIAPPATTKPPVKPAVAKVPASEADTGCGSTATQTESAHWLWLAALSLLLLWYQKRRAS